MNFNSQFPPDTSKLKKLDFLPYGIIFQRFNSKTLGNLIWETSNGYLIKQADTYKHYNKLGKLHREDGPAIESIVIHAIINATKKNEKRRTLDRLFFYNNGIPYFTYEDMIKGTYKLGRALFG